jgi:hypothetical protein
MGLIAKQAQRSVLNIVPTPGILQSMEITLSKQKFRVKSFFTDNCRMAKCLSVGGTPWTLSIII